jgi:hypothetical protein
VISEFKVKVLGEGSTTMTQLQTKASETRTIAARSETGPNAGTVVTSIRNAGNGSAEAVCGPSSVATVLGTGFAAPDTVYADPSGTSREGSGVRVLVNGIYAPVLYVSPGAVSFACPDAIPGTVLDVSVETPSTRTTALSVNQTNRATAVLGTQFVEDGSTSETVLDVRVLGLADQDDTTNTRVLMDGKVIAIDSIRPVPGLFGVKQLRVHLPRGQYATSTTLQVAADQLIGEDRYQRSTSGHTSDAGARAAVEPIE